MNFGSLVFTPAVKMLQERHGSRRQYARMACSSPSEQRFGPAESEFLQERDSIYWATIGSTGWPYVQHRGGPKGFLRVVDDRTIAFADFRGNKQYISAGNLLTDNRVSMICVDYPQQARLKTMSRPSTGNARSTSRLATPRSRFRKSCGPWKSDCANSSVRITNCVRSAAAERAE